MRQTHTHTHTHARTPGHLSRAICHRTGSASISLLSSVNTVAFLPSLSEPHWPYFPVRVHTPSVFNSGTVRAHKLIGLYGTFCRDTATWWHPKCIPRCKLLFSPQPAWWWLFPLCFTGPTRQIVMHTDGFGRWTARPINQMLQNLMSWEWDSTSSKMDLYVLLTQTNNSSLWL